jgi:hypothetical protein
MEYFIDKEISNVYNLTFAAKQTEKAAETFWIKDFRRLLFYMKL